MSWSRRRKLAVTALVLLSATAIVADRLVEQYSIDQYLGQPQVTGLPAGYDPLARTEPYAGPHPLLRGPDPDPYPYPIPVGGLGPVMPTYMQTLEYPYACRTETSRLGQPVPDNQEGAGTPVFAEDSTGQKTEEIIGYSKDCSLRTTVRYYYRSNLSREFVPLHASATDIDEVSVNGDLVPFVVRLEFGTINRHIYVIALLRGPDDSPEAPDLSYWNRKLVYQLRGGVGIGHRQGRIPPAYIPDRREAQLRAGYAIAYSTANQTSNSYDIDLATDTMVRVKRHFAARYGRPRYTIGIGSSGGALQQYLIGQNRPGLLDAGIAMYSYPDMVTQTTKIMDCELLEYFFDVVNADNEKWRKASNRSWVMGLNARDDISNELDTWRILHELRLGQWPDWSRGQTECSQSWRNLTPQIANPRYNYFASLFAPEIQRQVPWTYWDNLKQVYGTDGDGYARRTFDNVGVQYGLQALRQGRIDIDEFLHLNALIGGWKDAADWAPERYWLFAAGRSSLRDLSVWSHHNMAARRNTGDAAAIAAAYRSGQVFIGKLPMPIIDYRDYLEPELNMHHSLQSFSARLRMLQGQGHADNQLIWFTRPPARALDEAFDVLDRWLETMLENPGLDVLSGRPADANDRCYAENGQMIAAGAGVWDGVWNDRADGACMEIYPIYSNPRIVAGDSYAGDIFKCHLQSIDAAIARGLYAPVDVSAYRERLLQIFPDGVCDYAAGDAGRPEDLLSN